MKFKTLFFSTLVTVFSLVACNDLGDIEYLGIPKIALSETQMSFDDAGGDQSLVITANRPWKVETSEDWVIVDPENGDPAGGQSQVTVSVLENSGLDRVAELKFSLGMRSKSLVVSQKGPQGSPEDLVVYYNNYDKEVATQTYGSSGSSWPYLDQFAGWKNATGTGAGNVSYSFKGMSARANSTSNSNYSDYDGSGNNNMFFGASAYLATRNIALNGATGLTLTFGSEKYSKDNGSVFTNSEFHIFLSADDAKWVELTDYTFAGGTTEGRWNLATAEFSVPEATEKLSVCIKVDVASSYRMDDLKLVKSEGGAVVDFSNAVEMDFGAAVPGGNQGGDESDANALYHNNFDKEISAKQNDKWPYLDQFDGWKNAAGKGAAGVAYSYKSASVRASSGNNNIWLPKTGGYISIQDIALNGETSLQLTFGAICGSPGNFKKDFNPAVFKVWLSSDKAKWVELPFNITPAAKEFDAAEVAFSVPTGTEVLSITFEKIADETDGYRVDDVKLDVSQSAGTAVDFGKGQQKDFGSGVSGQEPDTPPAGDGTATTIAQVLSNGVGATLASGTTVEGVVISNMALNNLTSKKGMYVQDATAGLQFYLAENHEFAFGDKVKVDLGGAKIAEYNGAVQISGLALNKITKISSGNAVTPKTVSVADFLANKYEGQYIAVEGVQVADSDLDKTFVAGGSHTSINVETADGKKFVIFSAKYASYGTSKVPQGSGTIKGISSISKGTMQLIFAQESDFAGLTGARFGSGQGGQEPDTPPAGDGTATTIAQVLSNGVGATLASGTTVEGVVISNMALNNLTSKKGMYVQDATAGLQFYLAENHEFAFGDKVKVDLGGAKIAEYNGAVQISGLALNKITKISSGNAVTPKTVSVADFLANKYEGQYIAVEGVQVADSDLDKTFVAGGSHTSINVETADGKKFVIFSAKYASYGTSKVPQGSGTIKGISSISNGAMQLIFAQESDFAGLTGARFDGQPGGQEPDTPPVESGDLRADFETISKSSSYSSHTTAAGWVLTNCAVQEGGEKDSNPNFIFIGKVPGTSTWAKAACINGKTAAVGTIESPELAGGCGQLSFNYGLAFKESEIKFKIEVIQGGTVVKTLTVEKSSVTQKAMLSYTADINVAGTFKLKFTNLCPSNNASSNKDRVSIWNLTWTACK